MPAATNYYGSAYLVPTSSRTADNITSNILDRLDPTLQIPTGSLNVTPSVLRNAVIGKRIDATKEFFITTGGTDGNGACTFQFVWAGLTGTGTFTVSMSLNGLHWVPLPTDAGIAITTGATFSDRPLTGGLLEFPHEHFSLLTPLTIADGGVIATSGAMGSAMLTINGLRTPLFKIHFDGVPSAGTVEIYQY